MTAQNSNMNANLLDDQDNEDSDSYAGYSEGTTRRRHTGRAKTFNAAEAARRNNEKMMFPYRCTPVDFDPAKFVKAVIGEFFATMLFCYIGLGSVVSTALPAVEPVTGGPGHNIASIALAFGFGAAAMVHTFGHISGGHFNPAVTTALFIVGKTSVLEWIFYIIAQMGGGIAGAGLLYASTESVSSSCNGVPDYLSTGRAFIMEATLTFLLVFVVFSTIDPQNTYGPVGGPLAIGLAIMCAHFVGITQTGTGINPARSLGPAVISGDCWDHHWIFWGAPLAGGAIAGIFYMAIFSAGSRIKNLTDAYTARQESLSATTAL